jgi:hypothetical protein
MTESTMQRWDPVSGLRARSVAYVLAPVAFLLALTLTFTRPGPTSLWPSVAALLVLGAACVVAMVAADPLRAPYTRAAHLGVISLGLVALLLDAAAMWGEGSHHPREHWGPIAFGVLVAAHAPFRPAREIALLGGLGAAGAGWVLSLDPQLHTVPAGPSIVIGMGPVLGLTVFSAVLAGSMIRALRRWHEVVTPAAQALVDTRREGISRTVRQEQVTALNQDVVPFLFRLLDARQITDSDRDQARRIADGVRAALVAASDRSWLDELVEHAFGLGPISDPERLAEAMDPDQRTALRALLVAAARHPGFHAPAFELHLSSEGGRAVVRIVAMVRGPEHAVHSEFAPYFAVMRVVFTDLQTDGDHPLRRLKFSYGHK